MRAATRRISPEDETPTKITRSLLAAIAITAAMLRATLGGGAQQLTPQYRIEPVADLAGAPGLTMALRKLHDPDADAGDRASRRREQRDAGTLRAASACESHCREGYASAPEFRQALTVRLGQADGDGR